MNSSHQQVITDIENQYSVPRFWNVKLPGRPIQDPSTDILRKYFKGPEHPWNQKPNQADIENQLKAAKQADSPHVDRSKIVLQKYFTDPNEPWNKC
jgi:hypothetical protein